MAKDVSILLTCIAFLTITLIIWESLRFSSLAEYSYTAMKNLGNLLEGVALALFTGQ